MSWSVQVGGSAQLPPFPLWLLLAYYAVVVGGWLWNSRGSAAIDRAG